MTFSARAIVLLLATVAFFAQDACASGAHPRRGKHKLVREKVPIPQSYDEAIRMLIETTSPKDIEVLRSYPVSDLISFHFGWGMYIRNRFGLWDPKSKLLASCARFAKVDSIHPDNASGLLIRGVWFKLHENLDIVDFDTVAPERYFEEIHRTLRKAKEGNENGYLASLPGWIFQTSDYSFWSGDSIRNRQLGEQARKRWEGSDEFALLALKFEAFFRPYSKELERWLERLLQSRDRLLEFPSYDNGDDQVRNRFIQTPRDSVRTEKKPAGYLWHRISHRDFAALCLGSMWGKQFNSADDYDAWMVQRRTNEFVHWSWIDTVTADSLRKLSSSPRRFLEIVVLSKRFFRQSTMGEENELEPNHGSSTQAFVSFMGYDDSTPSGSPFVPTVAPDMEFAIDFDKKFDVDAGTNFSLQALHALAALAHSLSREDLLAILDSTSVRHYDSAYKTEDLFEYKLLGNLLLVSELERIVGDEDKNRVFEICLDYWTNRFVSWPMKDHIAEMLYRIDKDQARGLFSDSFRAIPTDGSFERNSLLKAMIRHDFQGSKRLIERWYWISQDRDFRHHPSEAQVIVRLLKSTSDSTRSLHRKISRDRRFRPPPSD